MTEWITKDLIFKVLKFGTIGFAGMLVDFGITCLCKELIKIPKFVANAIGFTCAAVFNYYLNRIWTFHSNNANVLREFSDFFVISVIGLVINTIAIYICVKKLKLNFYLSKLIAIGVTSIWNFAANYLYTFA